MTEPTTPDAPEQSRDGLLRAALHHLQADGALDRTLLADALHAALSRPPLEPRLDEKTSALIKRVSEIDDDEWVMLRFLFDQRRAGDHAFDATCKKVARLIDRAPSHLRGQSDASLHPIQNGSGE